MQVLLIIGIIYLVLAALALWLLLAILHGAGRDPEERDERTEFERSLQRWRHLRKDGE